MPDGYIVIRPSAERDPDGSKLRGTLEAQMAIDRASAMRQLMVHLVAWFSVPVALCAAWTGAPRQARGLVLAAWATALAGALIAGAWEWKHHRRRTGLMAALGCPPEPGA